MPDAFLNASGVLKGRFAYAYGTPVERLFRHRILATLCGQNISVNIMYTY
jgi:hypothetical protein